MYFDQDIDERSQINVSPVNFFVPNIEKYKHFGASTRQKVDLYAGDCLFVPAYYYYQMVGFTFMKSNVLQPQNFDMKTSFPRMFDSYQAKEKMRDGEVYSRDRLTSLVSLKFQGNS